jgi:DNA-binding SARP family transcriptional activator/tetratricopeptide (TPR) repeat protein
VPFRLETLGALRLVDLDTGAEPLKGRRMELALLAWLARRSPRPAGREELASLLWEGRDGSRARQSLRQALLRLKRELGDTLLVGPESVAVRGGALAGDAAEFEREDATGNAERAAACYGGDFLAGVEDLGGESFRLWLEAEREALRRRAAALFEKLSGRAEQDGDPAAGLGWAERWCETLPYDDRAELRRVALLRRLDRVPDAVRAHSAYVSRLRSELELEPSAELLQAGTELASAAAGAAESGRRSAALLEPELIGRGPALAALRTAWREAQGGAARCVVIEGEAGAGKTRLLDEFLRETAPRSVVLHGTALPGDGAKLWHTAATLLAPLADAPGLAAAAPDSLREAARLLPRITERFPSLQAGNGPANGGMEPALATLIREVAVEAPVLLAVDDAHLTDGATRGLLLRLARDAIPNILIVVALRPEHVGGTEFRQAGGARIKLQPLSALQVETLIDGMLSLDAAERRLLADRMLAEAEGNPFYTVELIGAAIDAELLRLEGDGSWRLAPDFPRRVLPLSPAVRTAIAAQLAALSAPARATLVAAAALGPRVDHEVLEAVAELPAGEMPAVLAELQSRRMLRPEPEGDASGFVHALIRRVAYESLAPAQRKELLRRRDRLARPGRPRLRVMAAAALVAVGAAVSLWIGLPARAPVAEAAPAREMPRLLVVAFKNETGDPSLNNLGRIAADWVSQGIARTGLLAVVPPALDSAALEMASDEAATGVGRVRALAAQARAGLVISGSFYWVGDSLQIQAVLTDVVQGRVLQAIGPERGVRANPMPAIERLRQRALGIMATHLDERLAAFAGQQSTPPSYEAYKQFAIGLDFWYRRMGSTAMPHLTRAYQLDTTFTLPLFFIVGIHRGEGRPAMADSVLRLLEPRRGELAPYDRALLDLYLAKEPGAALIAARAVAEIAPGGSIAGNELPDIALGLNRPGEALTYLSRLDVDKGEPTRLRVYWARLSAALHLTGQFERQLEIGAVVAERFPEDSRSYYYKARALAAMGRIDEIEVLLGEALRLGINPQWGSDGVGLHIVAHDELLAHGFPEAARRVVASGLRFCETADSTLQTVPMHRFETARLLYLAKRYREAKAEYERLLATGGAIGTNETILRGELGLVAAASGDSAGAAAADHWLRQLQGPYLRGQHTDYRARMAALLGRKDEAMRLIRQAIGEGYGFGLTRHQAPEYHSLLGFAPYVELMRAKG